MKTWLKAHAGKALFLPPILIAAAVLVIAIRGREVAERIPPRETATAVRVVAAPSVAVVPRVLGYGNVQPETVWEAVAEVDGRIVEVHPQLKKGAILPAGAVLLRIDPTKYRLAVSQIRANIGAVEAKLAELTVKATNTRASLAIEERSLALGDKDLERKRRLLTTKNISQSAVDQEERNLLSGQQNAQSLRNTLNLFPAERHTLAAELALYTAQLESARLDLERTTITAPFDCRVAEVKVQHTQYANPGQVLAVIDGIDVSEVSAQVPMDKLMSIIGDAGDAGDTGISPATAMTGLPKLLGLLPLVRLRAGAYTVEWPARLARISDTVDPATRTVGVIVAVDDPYRQARPGRRPPLAKNMFVEVELRGRPRPGRVVVPRAALHDGRLLVADNDNRLSIRKVEIAFRQTNFAVVGTGLAAGERVVVSDLIPAVNGMLLAPEVDEDATDALIAEAEGQGSVR
jgi:membrane fusion protein, multidrug efflux system